MKAYWHQEKNVGDTLTPIILKHFTEQSVEFVPKDYCGKVLAVGSILSAVRDGDTIWGTGSIRRTNFKVPAETNFLAVRGPLTRDITGLDIKVFGDPGVLVSDIYYPIIKKANKVGVILHYVDSDNIEAREFCNQEGILSIDVRGDWKTVIEQILSCELIISSSLHGIIIAESYGIPAVWIKLSNKIVGGEFKFQDYFLGTGREIQRYTTNFNRLNILPKIPSLDNYKNNLINVLVENLDMIIENDWL